MNEEKRKSFEYVIERFKFLVEEYEESGFTSNFYQNAFALQNAVDMLLKELTSPDK